MRKFKNCLIIAVIVIIVVLSGCTADQENEVITETETPAPVKTTAVKPTIVKTPVVMKQVEVTELTTLQDCIIYAGSKPCSLVNLVVRNDKDVVADIKIIQNAIVVRSGKDLGKRYNNEVGLSDLCVRLSGLEFKLEPNTDHSIGMCYPVISMSENPTLNLALMINGERKEFQIDLSN